MSTHARGLIQDNVSAHKREFGHDRPTLWFHYSTESGLSDHREKGLWTVPTSSDLCGKTISTRAAYCGHRTKSSLTTPSPPTRDEGFGDGRGDLPSWVEACRLIMERGPLITQPATQFVRIPGRVRRSLISASGQIDISVPGLALSLDPFRILAKPYPISIVHSGG